MKNLSKKQKIALGIFIVAVLSIIIFVFSNVPGARQNPFQKGSGSAGVGSLPGTNPSYPPYPDFSPITDATLPATDPTWPLGDNTTYTVAFPLDWIPVVDEVEGGGTHVFLHPSQAANQYFPRIDIEVAPKNPKSSAQERIDTIKKFTTNFSQATTSFRGQNVLQVSEVLPITDKRGNPVHKTYLFFEKGNASYVITMAYFQDEDAAVNSQTILQILNSFAFK